MNKINFTLRYNDIDPVYINKKYYVSLDRGYKFKFNNQKQAKAFIVQLSDFYTEHLRILNTTINNLFSKYQSLLFQMEKVDCMYFIEIENEIQKTIIKVLHNPDTINANYFKYKFFKDLYIYAKTYAQELHNKAEIVKEYSVRNDVKSFLNHIVFLEIQSKEFNQEKLKELNQISNKENLRSIQSLKVI